MGRSTGSAALKKWQGTLGAKVDRCALFAEIAGTEGEQVAEWDRDGTGDEGDVKRIGFLDDDWCNIVVELAQEDATSRGQQTRYEMRSFVGDDSRPRSRSKLVMVVAKEKDDDEKATLDGSHASIISQLQKGQYEANKQLFEMVKLTSSNMSATNALIAQLSTALREKEDTIGKLVDMHTAQQIDHAQQVKAMTEAAAKRGGADDDAIEFGKLLETALPHVMPELMKAAMPLIGRVLSAMAEPATAQTTVSTVAEVVSSATTTNGVTAALAGAGG